MNYFSRDNQDLGNQNEMNMDGPRRFGGMDDKSMADNREAFEPGRGRRPPFGRGGRRPSPNRDRSRDFGYGRDDMIRDRSPIGGPDDRYLDRGFPSREDHGRKDHGRPFYGDDGSRDRFEGRSRQDGGPGGYKSRFDGPNDTMKRPMGFPAKMPLHKYQGGDGFPKCNECEIIVINKTQRGYAESVETQIKEIGIIVDMVFLKDEALLTQTIDDMARKGTLYAFVIGPQNQQHGSVTVNILHGTPQEHRNMPLDDALSLLGRNFHEYVRVQKEKVERERSERGPYKGTVSASKEIQFLLHMIAEGRYVSLQEMNTVLQYLTERRDQLRATTGEETDIVRAPLPAVTEVAREIPKFQPKDDEDKAKKEQDLQDRIIQLINQGAPSTALDRSNPTRLNVGPGLKPLDDNMPKGIESKPPHSDSTANRPTFASPNTGARPPINPPATSTYINFDNDSVQKALDNLMQSGPNLLKNITMGTSSMDQTATSASASNIPGLHSDSSDRRGGGAACDNSPINLPGLSSDPSPDSMRMRSSNMGPMMRSGMPDFPSRGGLGNLADIGQNRSLANMGRGGASGIGGYGQPQRGLGGSNDKLGMNPPNTGYGGAGVGSQRNYGNTSEGLSSGVNSRGMPDLGRLGGNTGVMSGSDMGRGSNFPSGPGGNFQGSNFPGQNQFNRYSSPGQSSFPSNIGNMNRAGFGAGQSMGGPRRY